MTGPEVDGWDAFDDFDWRDDGPGGDLDDGVGESDACRCGHAPLAPRPSLRERLGRWWAS